MSARLERSTTNKVIAGVCWRHRGVPTGRPDAGPRVLRGGVDRHRGPRLLGYIVLIVLMPLPGQPAPFVKTSGVTTSTGGPATGADVTTRSRWSLRHRQIRGRGAPSRALRLFLIALGAIFLFSNAGVFRIVRWDLAWPLVFIAFGVLLLAQRVRR